MHHASIENNPPYASVEKTPSWKQGDNHHVILSYNGKPAMSARQSLDENIKDIEKTKIDNFSVVDSIFFRNWDRKRLKQFKDAKVLFINKDNEAFAISDLPVNKFDIPIESKQKLNFDILPVLEEAKKVDASSIIIAESCLPGDINNDSFYQTTKEQIKRVGRDFHVTLKDYLSFSTTSSSSPVLRAATALNY